MKVSELTHVAQNRMLYGKTYATVLSGLQTDNDNVNDDVNNRKGYTMRKQSRSINIRCIKDIDVRDHMSKILNFR